MNLSKRFLNISGGVAGLIVLCVIVIAANAILSRFNIRKDLTEEHLYTLSEGTKQVLAGLDKPVTMKLFFNESDPEVPVFIKNFAQRVEDLLVEYRVAAGGNIVIEKYDPEPDSDAEEWAQRYGLSGQSLGFMGPTLYLGLVAVRGDEEAVLPVLDPQNENLLEYNITRMITGLANRKKPVLGVLSPLPVLGEDRPPMPMPNQPETAGPWFVFKELQQDYQVRSIPADADAIDEDVDALILVHPKELGDATLYAVDQFVLRGGRLIAFVDPFCITEAEQQAGSPMQMQFSRNASDLGPLFKAWGVTYDPGKILADIEASSMLRVGPGNQADESPVWLSLRKTNMNAEDILTARLESVMLPLAGVFSVEPPEGVTATPLVHSSQTSAMVDAMTARFGTEAIRRQFKSGMIEHNIAVRLHGTFQTAFPDGKPKAEPAPDGEEAAEAETADTPEGLKESATPSTIILVADADLLVDRFCVRPINFFGFQAHQPINDNIALLINAVEQATGNTALVGIRTRGKTERPFEVVLDLQKKAQEKYLEEETRLQQKLESAQQRLNELQAQKDERQRFILSPQQQREIDTFQEQVRETKQELKLVRRKLRQDIEQLGVKVKTANILLMPLVVAAAGVGFWIYRKKRTRGR